MYATPIIVTNVAVSQMGRWGCLAQWAGRLGWLAGRAWQDGWQDGLLGQVDWQAASLEGNGSLK